MHSDRPTKMFGAMLTAAVLTLGVAAPALAEVKLGTPTQTGDTLEDKNDTIIISIPITEYKVDDTHPLDIESITLKCTDKKSNTGSVLVLLDDETFYNAEGFTVGNTSEAIDHVIIELSQTYSTLKNGQIVTNAKFVNGTYDLMSLAVVDKDGADEIEMESAPATVEDNLESNTTKVAAKISSLKVGLKTYNAETKGDKGKLTVSVGAALDTGCVKGSTPVVTFHYLSPSGVEETATGYPVVSSDKGAYATCTTDAMYAFATETGTYKLTKVVVVDTASGSRAEYTEGLEAGDFQVVNGTSDWVLRLYNPNSGEHFYTMSAGEKDLLVAAGWTFEARAFCTLQKDDEHAVEVYRAYNPNGSDHHYTTSAGEMDLLVAAGWRNEGVAFYGAYDQQLAQDNVCVYRLYNPNAKIGSHHYTTSSGERDLLVAAGWNDEGIGWFAPSESYIVR